MEKIFNGLYGFQNGVFADNVGKYILILSVFWRSGAALDVADRALARLRTAADPPTVPEDSRPLCHRFIGSLVIWFTKESRINE
jgi:hypothetical protein